MKQFIVYAFFSLMVLYAFGCNQKQKKMEGDNGDQTQTFATPEEAAKKAKSDLLVALRNNKDLKLGVNMATLEKAEPGKPVKQYMLDFNKLLSLTLESAGSFESVKKEELATVVPLVADGNIATIVQVTKGDKGWRVASLAGKNIADELGALRQTIGDTSQAEVTIYEVPNLRTRVYSVVMARKEMFYANYGNKLTMRQGLQAAGILQVLKADALEFQRKYGDQLKKGKLVE